MQDLAEALLQLVEQSSSDPKFEGLNPTSTGARLKWQSYMQDLAVAILQLGRTIN